MDNVRRSPSAESVDIVKGDSKKKKASKGRRSRTEISDLLQELDLSPSSIKEDGPFECSNNGDTVDDCCKLREVEPSSSKANNSVLFSAESVDLEKGDSKKKKASKGRRSRSEISDLLTELDLSPSSIKENGTCECSNSGDTVEDYCKIGEVEPSSKANNTVSGCLPSTQRNNQWRSLMRFMKKGSHNRSTHSPRKVPKFMVKHNKQDRVSSQHPSTPTSPYKQDLIPAQYFSDPTPRLNPKSFFKPSWKHFSFEQLKSATKNFSHDLLIGKGGYAEVYKGKMDDGNYVAIKRLMKGSQEDMEIDFLSELGIISHLDHPNIAKLIGCGTEEGVFIVLQLSPHGSLADILYGPRERLDWNIRFKVAVGTAEGIQYLHEGCQRRIIHRDIKAANILLSEDFEAQVADFGLAKWLPDQLTHHIADKVEGTFGYLPPEFIMHGISDEKTDVFAYGVLLLELITGRQALDSSQRSLVMWAKPLLSVDKIKELVDPCLNDAYDEEQIKIVMMIASLCIEQCSDERPQMSEVVKMLKGDEEVLKLVMERQMTKLRRTYSVELLDAEDYNSTKYLSLNDLNRESTPNSLNEENIQN